MPIISGIARELQRALAGSVSASGLVEAARVIMLAVVITYQVAEQFAQRRITAETAAKAERLDLEVAG